MQAHRLHRQIHLTTYLPRPEGTTDGIEMAPCQLRIRKALKLDSLLEAIGAD
jgi:hypothetical protein